MVNTLSIRTKQEVAEYGWQLFMAHALRFNKISLTDEHLVDTPQRVIDMYDEFFNPDYPIITTFTATSQDLVVMRDIPFYSICAHHWLPFFGVAHVAYIPTEEIIGLSKIPRLIDYWSHKPQVQEKLTGEIADHLFKGVEKFHPASVVVVLEGTHFCLEMRGVQKPGVITTTSALRGGVVDNAAQRQEIMGLLLSGK